jgi:hypothetical protein
MTVKTGYLAEIFLDLNDIQKDFKERIFGAISLLVPTGALWNKNFLAIQMSINTEPIQRTDISMKPDGPEPNYQFF